MNAMAIDDHDATDVSDAAGLRREVFSDALIDHVLAETRSRGLELTGKDGKDLPAPAPAVAVFALPDNGRS